MYHYFGTQIWMRHTYEYVMQHIAYRMAFTGGRNSSSLCIRLRFIILVPRNEYVTHVNASCHTHAWVMLHMWMSHATRMLASWCSQVVAVAAHFAVSDDNLLFYNPNMNSSHIWMRHVTHTNWSCRTGDSSSSAFRSFSRWFIILEPRYQLQHL